MFFDKSDSLVSSGGATAGETEKQLGILRQEHRMEIQECLFSRTQPSSAAIGIIDRIGLTFGSQADRAGVLVGANP